MADISKSDGGRISVIGIVLCLLAAVCCAAGVVCQKLALRHASAVQVTSSGCFTGTTTNLYCFPNQALYVRLCRPHQVDHGLITSTPVSRKSLMFRVARTAPRSRQMAAIWASKPSIGRPRPARRTITGPNQAAAGASNG